MVMLSTKVARMAVMDQRFAKSRSEKSRSRTPMHGQRLKVSADVTQQHLQQHNVAEHTITTT